MGCGCGLGGLVFGGWDVSGITGLEGEEVMREEKERCVWAEARWNDEDDWVKTMGEDATSTRTLEDSVNRPKKHDPNLRSLLPGRRLLDSETDTSHQAHTSDSILFPQS
jgi:hypothetical protein